MGQNIGRDMVGGGMVSNQSRRMTPPDSLRRDGNVIEIYNESTFRGLPQRLAP